MIADLGEEGVDCGVVRELDEATAEVKHMWVDPAVRVHAIGTRHPRTRGS
jgi:hypothetical protein